FFFQAEDGIRYFHVTGVQTCALPIFKLRSLSICTLALLGSCEPQSDPIPWEPLFNGKDLSGWTQIGGKANYRVENESIIGATVHNTPNSFMATEKMYDDFILELEYKVDSTMNSGI